MSVSRRVVVTGATRGLGRAMVAGLIEQGCTVIGCARNSAGVAELRADYGAPHRFDAVDVADRAAVFAWAESVLAAGEPPDLLLNNAAVIEPVAPLWQTDPAAYERLLDVNIKGVYFVCRAFLPAMVERGRGVIVNFSSGWGRGVAPEVGAYCASKFAVEGMTRALAEELPAGMAAIPLSPGVIDTDMLRSCWGPEASSYPKPAAWARRAVPYLLSLGREHNGQSLTVPA